MTLGALCDPAIVGPLVALDACALLHVPARAADRGDEPGDVSIPGERGAGAVMLAVMFARFLDRYPLPDGRAGDLWDAGPLLGTGGYAGLARQAAGLPLCGGLLRLAGAREGQLASGFIRDGFPELAAVAVPFAVDWIGRVVALDQSRPPGLLLFEPGSAEAFEIDESFADFFNVDVVDDPDLFLAADLFREWQAAGGEVPGAGQCVGFKAPLFLGGHGIAANLELTGLEVYWSFAAQGRGDSADSHHSIDPVP